LASEHLARAFAVCAGGFQPKKSLFGALTFWPLIPEFPLFNHLFQGKKKTASEHLDRAEKRLYRFSKSAVGFQSKKSLFGALTFWLLIPEFKPDHQQVPSAIHVHV
jgi:hypothetical protein